MNNIRDALVAITDITEHSEGYPVQVWRSDGRIVLRAFSEGGNRFVELDVGGIAEWIHSQEGRELLSYHETD